MLDVEPGKPFGLIGSLGSRLPESIAMATQPDGKAQRSMSLCFERRSFGFSVLLTGDRQANGPKMVIGRPGIADLVIDVAAFEAEARRIIDPAILSP
jgi:hypothetical protein